VTSGPLAGLRVLEFSLILSAPYGGSQLSDLGAEVVKVEQPGGDPFRNLGAVVPDYSKTFQSVNRGKRSIVIDLQSPEGRAVVHQMVPSFDVVMINYRPGVPARLGIDYETLSALHPTLIYVDISGFGTSGPMAAQAASDMVAQAYGGSTAADGRLDDDGAPVWMSIAIADIPTGAAAAMGTVAALYHRERTGQGQLVSASLLRTVMSQLGLSLMREPVSDAAGRDVLKAELAAIRQRGGSYDELIAARTTFFAAERLYEAGYVASDGGIVLGAITREQRDACRRVLGIDDDPTDDSGFDATAAEPSRQVAALKQRIRDRIAEHSVDEWLERFAEQGAPASAVNFPEEISDDPLGILEMVELISTVVGPTRHVMPTVHNREAPTAIQSAPPELGDATDDVLREIGGLDPDAIAALRASGAVA
jgi:crotonobetainyl-CoA:carnitine CoA-transferase CaiB-like acyl-CoA transferase